MNNGKHSDTPLLKTYSKAWAWSSCCIPLGIASTRRRAIAKAEKFTGEPWKKCSEYMEVRKVTLRESDHE